MKRTIAVFTNDGDHSGWVIECPACGYWHLFDNRWTFSGHFERPTFRPSMLIHKSDNRPRCHSFVTDGKIEFLSDCDHAFAGQTLDIPYIED